MKILLITGGLSSERKISLMSSKNVKEALMENGHKVKLYDLKNGYLKIKKIVKDFDVIFPILHGEEGEGGKLHKYLRTLKKPIVGTSNYQSLKRAWFKISFKKFCDKKKILTPRWKIIKNKKDILNFDFPCVLKVSSGGSSKEVFILKSKKNLKNIPSKFNNSFFVEKYIQGKEITVGILNNKALPIIKIIPPKGEWFSYKNKYTSRTKEIINPKDINILIKKKLQKTALSIHKNFNLGSYSRIDFILDNNNFFVLEVNTIPGLTRESLLPKMVKAVGLDFKEFINLLIKLAIKDFNA